MFLAESYLLQAICQSNEPERDIKHKTGGAKQRPDKNLGGHGPPRPPLEAPLPQGLFPVSVARRTFSWDNLITWPNQL